MIKYTTIPYQYHIPNLHHKNLSAIPVKKNIRQKIQTLPNLDQQVRQQLIRSSVSQLQQNKYQSSYRNKMNAIFELKNELKHKIRDLNYEPRVKIALDLLLHKLEDIDITIINIDQYKKEINDIVNGKIKRIQQVNKILSQIENIRKMLLQKSTDLLQTIIQYEIIIDNKNKLEKLRKIKRIVRHNHRWITKTTFYNKVQTDLELNALDFFEKAVISIFDENEETTTNYIIWASILLGLAIAATTISFHLQGRPLLRALHFGRNREPLDIEIQQHLERFFAQRDLNIERSLQQRNRILQQNIKRKLPQLENLYTTATENGIIEKANLIDESDVDIPNNYTCPITFRLKIVPIKIGNVPFSYEGNSIISWLKRNRTIPLTNEEIPDDQVASLLSIDDNLRNEIWDYINQTYSQIQTH